MTALILTLPLLPGRAEAWRRTSQVMQESRHQEYEISRRRLGITRELVWLAPTHQGELVIIYLETADIEHTLVELAQSAVPFDGWFRQQIALLCSCDLSQLPPGWPGELLSDWHNSSTIVSGNGI